VEGEMGRNGTEAGSERRNGSLVETGVAIPFAFSLIAQSFNQIHRFGLFDKNSAADRPIKGKPITEFEQID
jgi:hypothetical protein